jgi:2-phosphosulfolactate phosphatase
MLKPLLETCFSPALLNQYDTNDTIVVIIDVFRATSTIAAALDNGAKEIIPIASVEECINYKTIQEDCITAGERDGKVAPGLEYGNSPLEYPSEFITGKTLVLTTTNGTKLLHMVENAFQIITGSFLNLDAVCQYLIQQNKKVLLACAAWKDKVNMEDALFAGAVVHHVRSYFDVRCDASNMALSMYQCALQEESLLKFLAISNHYSRLKGFGLIKDLEYCTTPNLHPVVPIYDGKTLKVI